MLYGAIMYFYNVFFIIFHFPNQKFISPSILSVWLWPWGDWGSPQSGRPEEVGTPVLWTLQPPQPPLLLGGRRKASHPGCWFPVYFFMRSLSCVASPLSSVSSPLSLLFTLFLKCLRWKHRCCIHPVLYLIMEIRQTLFFQEFKLIRKK